MMRYALLVLWVEREQNKRNKWKMEKQEKKDKRRTWNERIE
jgi:hypothetical protein